jgi:hypothetical protein
VVAVKLWQSDYMECQRRLSLAPLPPYRVSAPFDKQTLHKVTLLQSCVRRAKQRKRSARTVEFVTWCETQSVVDVRWLSA